MTKGFQGVEVDIQLVNQRIQKMNQLKDQILSKLPNITTPKSKAQNKGWNSPPLISQYLTTHFPTKDLPDKLPSGIYPFDKTNRLKLLQKYPNNPIIKLVNDLRRKESIIEDLITIRDKSSQGILQYGYMTCGAATGRFITSRPAFHNFSKEAPNPNTLTLQEEIEAPPEVLEDRYNMRAFLLKRPATYFLDFKNQEYREMAYIVGDLILLKPL